MSYTPGPWEIMESANALVVMGANSKHVVIVPLFREHEWNKEEWEGLNLEEKNKVSIANTRLIAAAPELYQVCWELEKLNPNSYAAEKARKIIAKLQREGGEKS